MRASRLRRRNTLRISAVSHLRRRNTLRRGFSLFGKKGTLFAQRFLPHPAWDGTHTVREVTYTHREAYRHVHREAYLRIYTGRHIHRGIYTWYTHGVYTRYTHEVYPSVHIPHLRYTLVYTSLTLGIYPGTPLTLEIYPGTPLTPVVYPSVHLSYTCGIP